MTTCAILIEGWAGRDEIPGEIVGETASRYRVKLLRDARLPGGRDCSAGDVRLIPKSAVRIDRAIEGGEKGEWSDKGIAGKIEPGRS